MTVSARWAPRRPEYYVQTGGMHENPFGVPRDEIVRMILENPPEVTAQVVFGKYVESSGLVFISDIVQRLFDRSLPRIAGSSYIDQEAADLLAHQGGSRRYLDDTGNPFATGVDLARQTDYTVITTLDTTVMPARVVYYRRLNRVPWETIYREIGIARLLWGPNILCDSTGMGGDVVMDALESRLICPEHRQTVLVGSRCLDRDGRPKTCHTGTYLPLSVVEGFAFSGTTKKQLVEHLRNVLSIGYDYNDPLRDFGWLRSPPIVQLEEEMSFYAWDDKRLETDCLFSLALAAWLGLEDPVGEPDFRSPAGA